MLADQFGERLLLKGGTLLSKVDVGYHRMSEDVDLVVPLEGRAGYKPANARAMNEVRDALKRIAPLVGLAFPHPDGERSEKHAHVIWTLPYSSPFGPQAIIVEVSRRSVLRPPRRAVLGQLLTDLLAGDYGNAFCWALDADEARAEKVRAACTRTAGRDFFDLDLLSQKGLDLSSEGFRALVDQKLAEMKHPPLRDHEAPFNLVGPRRAAVEESLHRDLPAVLRADDSAPDLDALIVRFHELWL